MTVGTFRFDGYPTWEEWSAKFEGYCGMGSAPSDRYYCHLPVWSGGNVYFNGARPWEKERDSLVDDRPAEVRLIEQDGQWRLQTNLPELLNQVTVPTIATASLGMAFEPEQKYENPDGSPITFNEDYFGNPRGVRTAPGPIAEDGAGWGATLFKD